MSADSKARWFALLAGALDLGSGFGLALCPRLLLATARLSPVGAEAGVYLRWVGCGVAAVGATYLWAGLRGPVLVRPMLELTLPGRAFTGLFVGTALALGWLQPRWLAVAATDLIFLGLQIWFLKKTSSDHVPASHTHGA